MQETIDCGTSIKMMRRKKKLDVENRIPTYRKINAHDCTFLNLQTYAFAAIYFRAFSVLPSLPTDGTCPLRRRGLESRWIVLSDPCSFPLCLVFFRIGRISLSAADMIHDTS